MRREYVIWPYIICVVIFTIFMYNYCKIEPKKVNILDQKVIEEVTLDEKEETTIESTTIVVTQPMTTIETTKDSTIEYTTEYNDISNQGSTSWYITAYCPCSICCGVYANSNTRYDENGNVYHVGASGATLIAGYSVASSLPFGTKIYIEGIGEVCVTDRGVSGNHLDLYFDTHEQALQFGTGRYNGYIIGG